MIESPNQDVKLKKQYGQYGKQKKIVKDVLCFIDDF